MEKKVHEWNRANEAENYTLRGWAWFKGNKEENIIISGMHDRYLGFDFETALIGIQPIPANMFNKEDYKILKDAYEGKNLLEPTGNMGVRESIKTIFEDYTNCYVKPVLPEGVDWDFDEKYC
ncbi:hypothetical protein DFP73DRAFT_596123 [Morchella snyderi]|nr:hypothetical protein DFP73DRAFT_596123 [Morchella snyderi]